MANTRIRDFDISSRVTIHDVHQFEVKLEYNLEELQKSNNYKIETYFFIPSSLQVDEYTYPREEFYNDLQNYIRFKTPSFSFKLILDKDFAGSPLNALEELKGKIKDKKDHSKRVDLVNQAIKELKLLGTMVRARLRDFKFFIRRKVSRLDLENGSEEEVGYPIKRLRNAVQRGILILERVRGLRKEYKYNFPQHKDLLKYFKVVEEYLSHILEGEMAGILKSVRTIMRDNADLAEVVGEFKKFCRKEKTRRRKEKFNLIIDEDDEESKEKYVYYMGQFKKILSSVLYIDVVRGKTAGPYLHAVGSIAAFTASLIYFAITFYISQQFAIDSLPFIVLISVGYVFKDRIKDILKLIMNPRVLSRFPDHATQLQDTYGKSEVNLGEIREKVFFQEREKVDPVVLSYRDKTRPTAFMPEESPEEILVYQKEINVNTTAIMEQHSRTVNLTDIMRFNIHKYLMKMDDPEHMINYFDCEEGEIKSTIGGRTYHLNLVLKYSKFKGQNEIIKYERFRLVLNKWGIQRIEFIEE